MTNYFNKDLFIIRYEKPFFLITLLIVAIIQFTINDAMRSLPIILMAFLFIVISYVIFSWVYEKIKTIRELKNEKLNSELSLLRSQINPHFFFNTLNNLYGLAIEKSEETPKTILKLSEMMRYTIYDGKKDNVNLEKEISFLKNYIDLHTIRHHNKLDLKFEINNKQPNLKIAPLLLINLLENAFKHGAEKLEKDAFIHINIASHSNILNFVIENNFDDTETSKGIGLENLKRRLQLLYPNSHDFNTSKHSNIFRAELSLYLNQ
ncbi:hypothetical protein BTO18_11870 [Polaribacter porphyrae]|uniref:Signal transduction histidine kinase internal region domain-containing protein n=2 Tax=Polaribacter porphyrae TaxID=1137780 RepID=A0A2S7WU36_9FLAO|nr:hypothetical protein BTO18_11870 [Polaribacter porphyrae]